MTTDNYFDDVYNNLGSFSLEQKNYIYNAIHREQSRDNIEYYFNEYALGDELTELSKKYSTTKDRIIDVLADSLDKRRVQNEYDNWADDVNYDIDYCLKDML